MNLKFDLRLIEGYRSQSQKIRILTESWVGCNILISNLPISSRIYLIKNE